MPGVIFIEGVIDKVRQCEGKNQQLFFLSERNGYPFFIRVQDTGCKHKVGDEVILEIDFERFRVWKTGEVQINFTVRDIKASVSEGDSDNKKEQKGNSSGNK